VIKGGTGIFGHVLCRVLSPLLHPILPRVSSWRAGARIWAMPLILVLALASACTLAGERRGTESPEGTHPERLQGVRYEKVAFEALPGWAADDHAAALAAFLKSCPGFEAALADGALVNRATAGDGRAVCEAARRSPPGNSAAARDVFERYFTPYAVRADGDPDGLFTGYFEPLLFGADRPDARFRVPLYRPPDDLAAALAAGQPHYSRSDIDGGALDGRNLELLWVDDPLDAFFLHIQGSGRVAMADGQIVRVGFAGKNGHPYVAIGRELIAKGAMTKDEVSMPAIRKWLENHPAEAARVMALNSSYVYFRIIENDSKEGAKEGPIGAMGVALTPGRSVAVDPAFVPYGAPVWLDTVHPQADPQAPGRPLRRLLIAQDTGTAIKGPVRGDVFWGHGAEAAARAGVMKSPGRWYLLFPNAAPPSS
jgi:membrane-bound lytic murein transglycosylase A